jgi:hypothetical protein
MLRFGDSTGMRFLYIYRDKIRHFFLYSGSLFFPKIGRKTPGISNLWKTGRLEGFSAVTQP